MKEYVKQSTGERLTVREVRALYPEMTIGPNADLTSLGYADLEPTTQPVQDPGHDVVSSVVEYEPGKWREQWTQVPRDLETYRVQKHNDRKQAIEAAQYGEFTHNGETFLADPNSRVLLNGAVLLALAAIVDGTPAAIAEYKASLGKGWRNKSGQGRITEPTDMIALGKSLAAHIATTDAVNQAHKAAIDAATTIEELSAIDPTTGY